MPDVDDIWDDDEDMLLHPLYIKGDAPLVNLI
jgi:hypothetical protein